MPYLLGTSTHFYCKLRYNKTMNASEMVKQYLDEKRVMQVATSVGGQPWICTVYFATDDQQNIYWLSLPTRRHSQEIENNQNIAVTIVVSADQPVIGVQIEGTVSIVEDEQTVKTVMQNYIARHDAGKDYYGNFTAGTAQHKLYKLAPKNIVLFDEKNFSGNPRQTI